MALTSKVRQTPEEHTSLDVSLLWEHSFPSTELVAAAASLLTPMPGAGRRGARGWDGPEGPRARLTVGPGMVALGRTDPARAERAESRERDQLFIRAKLVQADLALPAKIDDAADQADAVGRLAAGGLASDAELRDALDWLEHLEDRKERVDAAADAPAQRGSIVSWSSKSRAAMVRKLAQLDYAPLFDQAGVPAMLTLTYPGDWLAVVPSAAVAKAHVDTLKKAFQRAYGRPLIGVWKREFQRRGAPHYHVHMVPPTQLVNGLGFAAWISAEWARIVGAKRCGQPAAVTTPRGAIECCEFHRHLAAGTGIDYAEGMRAKDPKRLAVYFSKHGAFSAKDYQNEAPAEWVEAGSVGRFWGVWGLPLGSKVVEVSPVEATAAVRTMRRWQNANGYRVQRDVWRQSVRYGSDPETGELRRRKRKSGVWSGARIRGAAGFVTVNDGPAFVSQLARYLDQVRERQQAIELEAWATSPARARLLEPDSSRPRAPRVRCDLLLRVSRLDRAVVFQSPGWVT